MLFCIVSRHSHLAGCWLEICNDNSENHRICWNPHVSRNLGEHCFDLDPFPSIGNEALELIMAIFLTVSKNILCLVRKLEMINNDKCLTYITNLNIKSKPNLMQPSWPNNKRIIWFPDTYDQTRYQNVTKVKSLRI